MKQVVVVSGKGGTGKTSVTAALAHLAYSDGFADALVTADADVDAANLGLVLAPQIQRRHDFQGGQTAVIDPDRCGGCGDCAHHCRYEAIIEHDGGFRVDPLSCEGCGVCMMVCPNQAVTMETQLSGQLFQSISRYGPLVHAALRPAQENSGKLVSQVRQRARQIAETGGLRLILIDGPPGIGCPVISALTGVDLALIVSEPTLSGRHDLERIAGLTHHFGIRSLVSVNKADLNPGGAQEIQAMAQQMALEFVGNIPYDPAIPAAMAQAQPVTHFVPESSASLAIRSLWDLIAQTLNQLD